MERQVLELRAGVGIAHTRTRAQVARLTGLRTKRVARLEDSGLRRLRGLRGSGSCSAAAGAAGGPTAAITTPTGTVVPGMPSIGVLGHRESSRHAASSRPAKPTARPEHVDRPLIELGSAPIDLAPLVVALALGGLVFVVLREVRRS